jgi:hypothetical protein
MARGVGNGAQRLARAVLCEALRPTVRTLRFAHPTVYFFFRAFSGMIGSST